MKFFALFLGWATAAFVLAWFVSAPYQHVLAAVAGRLAAPAGTEVEWVDLQLFFPYDLSVYVALCAASLWASWRARGTALAIGLPILVLAELVALVIAMKAMIATMGGPVAASASQTEAVGRFATGIIRVTGLVAAAAAWLFFLGWERIGAVLGGPGLTSIPKAEERMNPELQSVVDRLELVERQNRAWKAAAFAGSILSVVALALVVPLVHRPGPPLDRVRVSVVEANRLLLRDLNGTVVGGLEVDPHGTVRLVLGTAKTAAALIEVQQDGLAHLTLRGTDGSVRAALVGGATPSLALSPEGRRSSAALATQPDGSGALLLTDALGETRFHAP